MKTIRFNRDTDQRREGGNGFKAGDTVTLQDTSANRWIRRGAADEVQRQAEQFHAPAPAVDPVVAQLAGLVPPVEKTDGNPVESAPDVVGADGGNTGNGQQPDAPASPRRGPGRPAGSGNQR